MVSNSFVDLCRRVRSTWPKVDKALDRKVWISHVSLRRSYTSLTKFWDNLRELRAHKKNAQPVLKGKIKGEAEHIHQCSLNSKHYHLMIHGEAIARRLLAKERIFACNSREREIAHQYLQKLNTMQACLRNHSIEKVTLDEDIPDYQALNAQNLVERHFLLTRITNYYS